ncbi:MAG: hypothetical protein H0U67_16190 [Gemmatimonadetes bacterium]|nr:hypothetical protein [Gemmatimonadota bacterium]
MLEGQPVNLWRFGRPPEELLRGLQGFAADGWVPDEVLVECFTSFWWRGAWEAAALVRGVFPEVRIRVTGGYAAAAPAHIREVLAAEPLYPIPEAVSRSVPDWLVAGVKPTIAYLSTSGGVRSAAEVVAEFSDARKKGVTLFAFAEHGLLGRLPDLFGAILEDVAAADCKRAGFVALGNVAAAELAERPEFAVLMRQAGYRHVFFADDRDVPLEPGSDDELVEACAAASAACHAAGFLARSDSIAAGVCLGRAGEDLGARARLITRVAHAAGSVVIWPYQPAPTECPEVELELCNGKLFPLRSRNRTTYRDYLNVQALGAVMNAKYRELTFDFLGNGLVARMFRDSLAREAWVPDPAVKGSLQLPAPRPRAHGVT